MMLVMILASVGLSPQFSRQAENPSILPAFAVPDWPNPIFASLAALFVLAGICTVVRLFITMGAKRIGDILVAVGFVIVLASCTYIIYSSTEESAAESFSESAAQAFFVHIELSAPPIAVPSEPGVVAPEPGSDGSPRPGSSVSPRPGSAGHDESGAAAVDDVDEGAPEGGLKSIMLDGASYIGVLSIPKLDLNLPVNKTWSYPELKRTPCRYSGGIEEGSLVVAAHNYRSHFRNIDRLGAGEAVTLTDAEGNRHSYETAKLEIVAPTSVDAVVNSEYDLTLFTCTSDGNSRIVLRCVRAAGP